MKNKNINKAKPNFLAFAFIANEQKQNKITLTKGKKAMKKRR